jgi:hypothetical protein
MFTVDASFLCDNSSITAGVLLDMIKNTLLTFKDPCSRMPMHVGKILLEIEFLYLGNK